MIRGLPRLVPSDEQAEKATRQIIIGRTREGDPIKIWIGANLHAHLTSICARTHNQYRQAFLMSAERGAPIIVQALSGVNVIERDSLRRLIDAYSESIRACAVANGCSEIQALEIILSIGSQHGELSGWVGDEKADTAKVKA
jgi:hypothetical protein